jgi:soluble cytochrome b562
MESTRGDLNAFTEGTIEEVLARAQAETRRETEAQLLAEVEKREAAERRAQSATEDKHESRREVERRLENFSLGFGRVVTWLIYASVLLLVPLGMYQAHSLPLPLDSDLKTKAAAILQACIFVAFGFALYSQFTGGSVREVVRGIEVKSANSLRRWLVKHLLG